MKKIKFIQKLVNEEVITTKEPSLEIGNSYHKKAENSLRAAKILIKQDLLEESTTMSYYSMYHKATALLNTIGIKCENHNATIIILKEILNIDTKDFSNAKTERIDKQYYTDSQIKKEDAEKLIKKVEKFIQQIDNFIDESTQDVRTKTLTDFKKTYAC